METIGFHPLAKIELREAILHYEGIYKDLGLDFQLRIEQALVTIVEAPERWRERPNGYRRYNLTRFPFYLPYVVRGDSIWIVAVAHGHRKPEYWEKRIDDLELS